MYHHSGSVAGRITGSGTGVLDATDTGTDALRYQRCTWCGTAMYHRLLCPVCQGSDQRTERSEGVGKLFEAARAEAAALGFDLAEVPMVGGGSDGNFTAALGIPTLDGLGVDGDGAHTLDEYCLISSIEPRRRLVERLLQTL